ncbi:hypothetical protein H072_7886 [Dactylellina haptotyla CBS 200.50]|uniref:poly(A)-specific ribonuclease n=1 Tax=Dactylellina haptotyla (strain CBS 200.50) TaxID=1284197 RepID=S8ABB5_DACHA|nr:hypothetical protein H072_7886 [Dactylellina haptotyla CBS 200.50]
MPPARGTGFGPTMHTPSPFGNQHLLHNSHPHASHHLNHHQMQPQHQQHLQHQSHHHAQAQAQSQHQQALQQQVAHAQHAQQQHNQSVVHPQATAQQQQSLQQQAAAAAATAIREVWKGNLEAEIAVLRDLVEEYPYIAMDTEFPGIVARPIGGFRSKADYHYQTLRCNVDMLKIIQLGITFYDENGKTPEPVSTWQFNFQFSLADDMYAQESIDLLTKSGIDFKRHEEFGINVSQFGELLISSGLVLLENVKWVSFHSGYDFGYLVKVMLCQALPAEENEFRKYLHTFFPALYDIKYLMKTVKTLKGGLQDIADDMGIQRVGPQHQAGSDSLLTGHIFFAMRGRYFEGKIDDEKYCGQVWGLNGVGTSGPSVNTAGATQYTNGQGNQTNGGHVPSTPTGNMSTSTGMTPGPMTPQQQMNPYAQPPPPQNSQQGVNPMGSGGFQFGKIGGM